MGAFVDQKAASVLLSETQSWTCSRPVYSSTLWPPLLDQIQTLFKSLSSLLRTLRLASLYVCLQWSAGATLVLLEPL